VIRHRSIGLRRVPAANQTYLPRSDKCQQDLSILCQELEKIVAVAALGERIGDGRQPVGIDPALAAGNLFRAANFQPLASLDSLDEVPRLRQRLMGPGIQPGDTPSQPLQKQLPPRQIPVVEIRDF